MRIRITFSKTGSLRYIGHLDLHQVWERTARRAALPLAYTQGFHPGPRLQIACALPLGISGRRELVDMFLDQESDDTMGMAPASQSSLQESCLRIRDALQSASPPGLTILQVEQVDERSPALQTQVAAAEYAVTFRDEIPLLQRQKSPKSWQPPRCRATAAGRTTTCVRSSSCWKRYPQDCA